jgi:hypothetical protein
MAAIEEISLKSIASISLEESRRIFRNFGNYLPE